MALLPLRLPISVRRLSVLALAAMSAVLLAGPLGAPSRVLADPTSTLDRPADPVVLTGADVPSLNGIAPNLLVAFKNVSGSWTQIPVQVDERHSIDVGQVSYRGDYASGFTLLVYSDPLTDTGADPTPTIDTNDEIVFMAKDAGGTPVPFSEPAGVVAGTGLQVTVTDPLTSETGVVYLFRHDGSLDPSAGAQYVTYTWQLTGGGTYLADYDIVSGNGLPNNEDSDIVTDYYNDHFSERWIHDELRILADGAAPGIDILDRHAVKYPGVCGRNENTFSNAEGGFFVNKSGPVRALRSYFGANSGPMTQREHAFYERRQDVRTFSRVHAIGGIQDFMDYAPAANGMYYYNNLNMEQEAIIDGQDGAPPDNVALGAITWELTTGTQGSLTQVGSVSTNIPGFTYTSLWIDDTTPPTGALCTGDGQAWGASGINVDTEIPCTDVTCTNYLNTVRSMYYDAPGVLPAAAAAIGVQYAAPLTYAVAPWTGTADSDGDTIPDTSDNCPSVANLDQANNDRDFTQLTPEKAFDDLTWPRSDTLGDLCDPDDDNDGRTDADELAGELCGPFTTPTDPFNRDTDGDRMLDGAECSQAVAKNPSNVNVTPPPACTAVGDADGDGVQDARELCFYGSLPSSADSDGDGCPDAREVASINADRNVNAIDLSQVAQAFGAYALPNAAYLLNFDITKDGNINAIDLGQVAQRFGTCPGIGP